MSAPMSRRQWLARSSGALGGAVLAHYGGLSHAAQTIDRSETPVRMMFNENPYGPSPIARKAMIQAFDEGNLYSSAAYLELQQLIAEKEDLSRDHVLIASGSTEILNVAGLLCGLEDGAVISPHPTFQRLITYVQNLGGTVHRVTVDDDLQTDLAAMRQKMSPDVRLVYICNPNNPTGRIIPARDLVPFCEELSQRTLVFVDEAYHEYVTDTAYRSMVALVRRGARIIVSRTASKIHGLAGLRVGFALAHPEIIRALRPKLTGTTNIIGLRAAIASYRDQDFQDYSREKNLEARQIVYAMLEDAGRRYLPSQTNFVFFHTGRPIRTFQRQMAQHGFTVGRPFPPYLDWCRLSMSTPENTAAFAAAFRQVMGI